MGDAHAAAGGELAEVARLREDAARQKNWKRWGPYLAERQWGTVREDYSPDGDAWNYFTHDMARSRCYRWGEDGILGITDRECRLCFSLAMWNGRDPILKERLFGLSGPEGNHGEDVKEHYFYLDSTPTHSYLKGVYQYPQAEFPYQQLVDENRNRTRHDPEFELADTGVFAENRYFDVQAEYAKRSPNDILIRLTIANRGPDAAVIHLLPQLFYRNTWSWGCKHEGCEVKPRMQLDEQGRVRCDHVTLGRFYFCAEPFDGERNWLFTENETNVARLFEGVNYYPNVRDAFHEYLIRRDATAINAARVGTKVAARYGLEIAGGAEVVVRLRLSAHDEAPAEPFGKEFDEIFAARIREAEAFYAQRIPPALPPARRLVARQAYAGLLWSKQFYHYIVRDWLDGDPEMPPPPEKRLDGRNRDWPHLFNRDVISMPDKWEYPWYAAWDLAFHTIGFARVDPQFAKEQLLLFLREWYMHPNGQLPAYEWALGDVNPPVHAWGVWRVYKMTGGPQQRDRAFLARAFQKLLINFTWWVNRKDVAGRNIFGGGFLGLDNVGVFDRNASEAHGVELDQADGTAWMAFYCGTMLSIALELASEDPVYEDVASKFFEHFVAIVDAINQIGGGGGLWDEEDGFYYDRVLTAGGECASLKLRSIVGLMPLIAVEVLDDRIIDRLPGFKKRMDWFLAHRQDLSKHISYLEGGGAGRRLLALPSKEKLLRVLKVMLDEKEFLSPFGLRSMSAKLRDEPFSCRINGTTFEVRYTPGESDTETFGGNSNWRGPIWFPLNYLIIEALEKYHHFYGDSVTVEVPSGSGRMMNLKEVALELSRRLVSLFDEQAEGGRVLFHEYFHGDTGQGLGASHQTGWTALVARLLEMTAAAPPDGRPAVPDAQPSQLQSV